MQEFVVGGMEIGPELDDALKAAQRQRGSTFDHWDFSVEAIEYLVTWMSLRAPNETQDYLAPPGVTAVVADAIVLHLDQMGGGVE